jgi:Flp pilus assembly protein TadD
VAHLLLGNLPRARRYLEQAPQSTAVLNDRATLALRQGKHQEALNLTELALRQGPNQPQATWNRALALDGLRQSRQAAEAFDRAAALSGAAGWREEARDRTHRLRLELSSGGQSE